jgi:hypothetical protein
VGCAHQSQRLIRRVQSIDQNALWNTVVLVLLAKFLFSLLLLIVMFPTGSESFLLGLFVLLLIQRNGIVLSTTRPTPTSGDNNFVWLGRHFHARALGLCRFHGIIVIQEGNAGLQFNGVASFSFGRRPLVRRIDKGSFQDGSIRRVRCRRRNRRLSSPWSWHFSLFLGRNQLITLSMRWCGSNVRKSRTRELE